MTDLTPEQRAAFEKLGRNMPCANCGKTYEEHRDGSAYRDFTGAGAECGGYEPEHESDGKVKGEHRMTDRLDEIGRAMQEWDTADSDADEPSPIERWKRLARHLIERGLLIPRAEHEAALIQRDQVWAIAANEHGKPSEPFAIAKFLVHPSYIFSELQKQHEAAIAAAVAKIDTALQAGRTEYSRDAGEPEPTPAFPVRVVFSMQQWDIVLKALALLEQRDALREAANAPACLDCGIPYSEHGLDTALSNEQWAMIHDSEGGILCGRCIAVRARKLKGAVAIRSCIEFANEREKIDKQFEGMATDKEYRAEAQELAGVAAPQAIANVQSSGDGQSTPEQPSQDALRKALEIERAKGQNDVLEEIESGNPQDGRLCDALREAKAEAVSRALGVLYKHYFTLSGTCACGWLYNGKTSAGWLSAYVGHVTQQAMDKVRGEG